jgi:serine/threonine protein kinase
VASRYVLLQQIGTGGMGVVFKAQDETLDEVVALKLLRPDASSRGDLVSRFISETKLARRVRHKNVCAIHDCGQDGHLFYISMEYVDGQDLRQRLRLSGPPDWEEAYDIALQGMEGLAAIHDAGIIHRDLKPANIMVDSKGVVRLMDFGIAKVLSADSGSGATRWGYVVGSPEYMSPEQVRDLPLDFRSDLYSLAVVLFELFTGRAPFQGETPAATILKHLEEAPPLAGPDAARLPPAVIPILTKALAKERDARYPTCAAMREDLERALGALRIDPTDAISIHDLPPPARGPSPIRLLVPQLLGALRLADATVRRDAAEILGTMDADVERIVGPLHWTRERDEDPSVRTVAAESLRRLGAGTSAPTTAIAQAPEPPRGDLAMEPRRAGAPRKPPSKQESRASEYRGKRGSPGRRGPGK